MKTKISYGIALCRYNSSKNNAVEILLIKKRFTYYFFSLVMGKYKRNDSKYIKYLFDNMSYSEKIDVLGMQFSNLWYRIFLCNPEKHFNISDIYNAHNIKMSEERYSNAEIYKKFFEKKNKFEQNFTKDGGKKLRNLIQQSSDAEIIWEIPKGGKNEKETNIDCAIREFYEETSVSYDKYKIFYDIDPVVDTIIDVDVMYKSIYYIAGLKGDLNPKINFKNFDQISEVEQIKWVSLDEIKFMCLNKNTHNKLINLYKQIIKKFKDSQKIKRLDVY